MVPLADISNVINAPSKTFVKKKKAISSEANCVANDCCCVTPNNTKKKPPVKRQTKRGHKLLVNLDPQLTVQQQVYWKEVNITNWPIALPHCCCTYG
jgi:hypothetical protein